MPSRIDQCVRSGGRWGPSRQFELRLLGGAIRGLLFEQNAVDEVAVRTEKRVLRLDVDDIVVKAQDKLLHFVEFGFHRIVGSRRSRGGPILSGGCGGKLHAAHDRFVVMLKLGRIRAIDELVEGNKIGHSRSSEFWGEK